MDGTLTEVRVDLCKFNVDSNPILTFEKYATYISYYKCNNYYGTEIV